MYSFKWIVGIVEMTVRGRR